MFKKGFTLIELLAVIIILAIVALIATPIILNVISDARISAGRSEASMIYSGINNYCATADMKNQLTGEVDICADGVLIEEIPQMVNLGNAKVTEVTYNGKVTSLVVESNNHKFTLCGDGSFAMDDEECSVTPPVEEPEEDYTDGSGANVPELDTNMVPIKYNGTNWVYADTTEAWYNYDNKEWANAVVLNENVTKNVGDTITEDEVSLWYVWIPRYKYQLFNADNGSVDEQLINVEFESGTASTGTVSCSDAVSGSGDSSETCTNATNGNWYTHPAFTFGSEQVSGFWVGKFEVSGSTSKITVKPGVSSLRYTSASNFFTAIQNIKNSYSLSGDSHMMKNMEWGAVAYLKQSKYGLGTTDITINSNSWFYTGGGSSTTSYKSNTGQSTTGNVYGIYDMSGGAYEYVMGNMVNSSGAFYSQSSGFSSAPNAKYYDKYTYNSSNTTYGRGKLGDATKETLSSFGSTSGGWYGNYAYFVSGGSWFMRGGYYYDYYYYGGAGVFYFGDSRGGGTNSYISARAVLIP